MWYYDSPVGRFVILKANDGFYYLQHDNDLRCKCEKAWQVADNFYCRCSEFDDWDLFNPQFGGPIDLSQWSIP